MSQRSHTSEPALNSQRNPYRKEFGSSGGRGGHAHQRPSIRAAACIKREHYVEKCASPGRSPIPPSGGRTRPHDDQVGIPGLCKGKNRIRDVSLLDRELWLNLAISVVLHEFPQLLLGVVVKRPA